jgi:transcriptional regulator GlxA family with amidase domain
VRTENAMLGLRADATFEELAEPDVIVFPGGVGTRPLEHDERVLDWVRHAHAGTRFTTSVCTGSIVLGAAGLLDGLTATTHWSCYRELAAHGAEPSANRVVEHLDRRIITAAGVSSGIDMALRLVELLVDRTAGQAAQLMIEYDPQPPFDSGAVHKSDDTVMTRVIEYAALRS